MQQKKYLFIDRDGTLIEEPPDEQVDRLDKVALMPGVIEALQRFSRAGYTLVMVTNQDGLYTDSFPEADFAKPQAFILNLFASQNIFFESIRICPHFERDGCACRKPKVGLLLDYLREQTIDRAHSFVIGDRASDVTLAENMGLRSIQIGGENAPDWECIVHQILHAPRQYALKRKTNETNVHVQLDLDSPGSVVVNTGIRFFDHMVEQLLKHAGVRGTVTCEGDVAVDDHHTVEDVALVLGEALSKALGDKRGIARYGFLLPMDESLAQVALDLSGRAHCQFRADFHVERVNDLSTEMVAHFFKSLSDGLKASLHVRVEGDNTHHMIEAAFKAVGRCFGQAKQKQGDDLPTTKGVL